MTRTLFALAAGLLASGIAAAQAPAADHHQHLFSPATLTLINAGPHMRASISKKRPYGAAQARAFIEQVLPAAPDIVVQVAHMAGTGPGYDDPRMRNVWFDVASVANGANAEQAAQLVKHIRQVGVQRIVYGSDAASTASQRPKEAWEAFRKLPLTDAEFAAIASNVAPYLR